MRLEHGITVPGGLPVRVTTCASDAAFDIVGQGIANVEALRLALVINERVAASQLAAERARSGTTESLAKS